MQLDQPLKDGALYGALATLVMTLIMLTGMGTGVAPMPEPIPKALAALFLGALIGEVAQPVVMVTGMIAHFAYGAAAGAVFDENCNWTTGLLWGAILWVIMQLAVLPIIGWGVFGLAITGFPPKIAVGTLVLHLIYGGILGWGLGRKAPRTDRSEPAQT